MTAPVFMAFPPEVHSVLLSSGPGPGALLSAAGAWNSLSEEYAWAATELTRILDVAQAAWQGTSADSYVAANLPYLAWLMQAATESATMADRHEIAAAAYTAALAAMPTIPELGANHATHAVLLATNFFGVNTIPIAVNEADYVRMWLQAATSMTTYQTVSAAALTSAPTATPAPQIAKSGAASAATVGYTGEPYPNPTNLSQTLADLQYNITAAIASFNGPTDPTTWAQFEEFWSTTFTNLASGIPKELASLAANPSTVLSYPTLLWILDFAAGRIFDVVVSLKFILSQPALYVGALGIAITNLGAAIGATSGLAGLAGLTSLPTGADTLPLSAQPPGVAPTPGVSGVVSQLSTSAAAPAAAPVAPSASTSAAVTASSGAGPAPPAPGPGGFPYLVGGVSLNSSTSGQARRRKPQSDTAPHPGSAPFAAVGQQTTGTRRRRRPKAEMLGRGYEYMDLDFSVDGPTASDRGAETLGFAGTAATDDRLAAGLATLRGNGFDAVPSIPMLPGSWGVKG